MAEVETQARIAPVVVNEPVEAADGASEDEAATKVGGRCFHAASSRNDR